MPNRLTGVKMETYKATGLSLSDREKYVLEYVSKQYGISLSAANRLIINDHAARYNIPPPTAEPEYHGEGAA